jgi:sugar lactone lactonase YvrE
MTVADAGFPIDTGGGTGGSNPIVAENMRAGTDAWTLAHTAGERQVEGYASATSVAPGETVTLYVNVDSTHAVRWEAYRLGYYQGHGARLVATSGASRTISPQPACPVDSVTGLIECHWSPGFTITPDASWVTGEYLIKLVRDDGYDIYVPLVVRETTPRAPLLFQASVTTYQAYNRWGGNSLYVNQGLSGSFAGPHAYRVSFDRPYDVDSVGSGEMRRYEMYMARWLEEHGYDVAYVTNIDVDADPSLLTSRRMFLSVGHDEYWSTGERDAVEHARDVGVSLGFFSANTSYWHVRIEPSTSGTPRRVVTGYKELAATLDPRRFSREVTTMWRDPMLSRPENAMIGVMYELWSNTDAFPFVVTNASHWIYEGTGLRAGDTLSHLVGYEWDHVFANGMTPGSLEVIGESPALSHDGIETPAHTTVYYPTASNLVFASGSIEWSWALSRPGYVDSRVGRMTQNVLARAGVLPTTPVAVETPPPAASAGTASSVSLVAGAGIAGYLDGPASSARFDAPAGVAVASDGTIYVTDQGNHRVRRISTSGTVSTLAGCGPDGATRSNRFADGTGTAACFDVPTGIVVRNDGTVLVSDTWNHRIRAITPAGVVTTYAGTGDEGASDASSPRNASFRYPRGLALASDGSLYIADTGNGAIRRISSSGVVTTVNSAFYEPVGIAVATDGSLYVTDAATATLWRVSGSTRTLVAGADSEFGDLDGDARAARLRPTDGVAVFGSNVVFADGGNDRVRAFALDGSSRVFTLVGNGTAGLALGTGASARVSIPRGIAATAAGLLVADAANHRVINVRP